MPFLGQNVHHQDFPLVGGNGELLCQNCHSEGVYAGTEKNCSSCHADSPPMGDNLSQNWMKAYILLHEPQPNSVMFIYPDHFEGESRLPTISNPGKRSPLTTKASAVACPAMPGIFLWCVTCPTVRSTCCWITYLLSR